MATITIKSIPDELYKRLHQRARENRRGINSEAIACLETVLGPSKLDPKAFLAEIRSLRRKLGAHVHLTDEEVQAAKRQGRL